MKTQEMSREANTGGSVGKRGGDTLWGCVWGIMALVAVWRLGLAWRVFSQGTLIAGQGAIVVHWRRLEPLVGWVALAVIWMGADAGATGLKKLREERLGRLMAAMIGVGVGLAVASIAWDQWNLVAYTGEGLGAVLSLGADLWLCLTGLVVLVRACAGIARDGSQGKVTVIHLFQLAAVQWGLAWMGATVLLRMTMKREELLGNESARLLQFYLPVLGVTVNTLMAAGIGWWDRIVAGGVVKAPAAMGAPRVRAWVLGLGSVNVGAVLCVVRPGWLGMLGGVLLMLGVGLYLVGFPAGALGRLKGRGLIVGAWMALVAGLMLMVAERTMIWMSGFGGGLPPVTLAFFGGAGRHLMGAGLMLLWWGGMFVSATGRGVWAVRTLAVSVMLTAGLLLAASFRQSDAQLPALKMLLVSTGLEVMGVAWVGWEAGGRRRANSA